MKDLLGIIIIIILCFIFNSTFSKKTKTTKKTKTNKERINIIRETPKIPKPIIWIKANSIIKKLREK